MRTAIWIPALLALLAAAPARSDTITKTDHLSVNGSLKKMSGGEITLEARFNSGTRILQISISDVDTIEFNDTTFNSGAPPKPLGIGPPMNSAPHSEQPTTSENLVVLRGNQRKTCKLTGIDGQFVHCAEKDGDYSRKIVLRILVGSQ